jgi:hypothetical protein
MIVNNRIIVEGVEKHIARTKEFLEKLKSGSEIFSAPPVTLSFSKLNKDYPDPVKKADYSEFDPLRGIKQAIYIVSTSDDKNVVRKKFDDAKHDLDKSGEKGYLCRLNKDNFDAAAPSGELCLYVGSSLSIVSRVKEHWGIVNPTTYAMHLKDWLLKGNDNEVVIEIWPVPDEYAKYIQIIEDGLWQRYKPVFGRQGAK